ncbi:hypothetical protein AAFF_G00116680 [Aldrovandia affinis]|uniref:Uncharacterized protein n=1 Tax=Aldrovandia affinis TaxID=143900 RepID=A0AAD7T2Q2_9TELE|nr:hypothetical protein AAFF_G00116680 [Aldrovandia affinis]
MTSIYQALSMAQADLRGAILHQGRRAAARPTSSQSPTAPQTLFSLSAEDPGPQGPELGPVRRGQTAKEAETLQRERGP